MFLTTWFLPIAILISTTLLAFRSVIIWPGSWTAITTRQRSCVGFEKRLDSGPSDLAKNMPVPSCFLIRFFLCSVS